jgi:integration host factor subunit alpha
MFGGPVRTFCPVWQTQVQRHRPFEGKDRPGKRREKSHAFDADQSSHRGKLVCKNIFTKSESSQVIETLFEIIKQTLEQGEDVLISGFGKFSVKEKNQRRGRNPQTGDPIMLAPRKVVTFKCSGVLREKINLGP